MRSVPHGGWPKTALRELGPGDIFGEMALLTDEPRSASIRAISTLEVMIITKDDLKAQQNKDHWLASFARSMAARFREVDRRYHAAKRAPKDQAVVNSILERMIFDGQSSADGSIRCLPYAKVLPLFCAELSRNEEEILLAISSNERLRLDELNDRIVLQRDGAVISGIIQ
ncbi:MAG: cyclic nucleotide-binding domain-containing protein [Deltaproteobacteria bacterium]|nr:cyclic nucleotide-binding domain-containing protein [Deltaproteobacteria bacterium]